MRICFDIQSAIAQRAGVGRYAKLLAQHLGATAGENRLVLFYFDFKRKGMPFRVPNATHKAVGWCPGRVASLAWKTLDWPPFDQFAGSADIYHFPNFIVPPLTEGKSVVTVHDVSFLRFPEFAEKKNLRYLSARISNTIERADAVITDSRFAAGEIRDYLHADPSRIFPVYPGVAEDFVRGGRKRTGASEDPIAIDRPYILTVATIEPRKNIPFLVDVFEKLTDFDGYLVIAGMRGWNCGPILQRLGTSSRAADIRYLEYVDDASLPALYAKAEAFVFTSFYEGFGFPPLESMACGTPVVSSARGSLAEVLGDGAVQINEFDTELWCDAIRRILSDSEHREAIIAGGRRQALRYNWSETARQTWSVYEKVAQA